MVLTALSVILTICGVDCFVSDSECVDCFVSDSECVDCFVSDSNCL